MAHMFVINCCSQLNGDLCHSVRESKPALTINVWPLKHVWMSPKTPPQSCATNEEKMFVTVHVSSFRAQSEGLLPVDWRQEYRNFDAGDCEKKE